MATERKIGALNGNLKALYAATTKEEIINIYNDCAEEYDKVVADRGYKKHFISEEVVRVLGDKRDVKILDAAAGTGIGGVYLSKLGFTNIDAVDGSQEMLNMAEKKNIYKKIICALILKEEPLPIENNTYDVITVMGGIAPDQNHMQINSLEELARILKPGGILVTISPDYAVDPNTMEVELKKYESENILIKEKRTDIPEYANKSTGHMFTLRKPKSG